MSDAADLPPEHPAPSEDLPDAELERPDGLIDRLRGTGVGVEDPNIVGDVGSTDVAPGSDPETEPGLDVTTD